VLEVRDTNVLQLMSSSDNRVSKIYGLTFVPGGRLLHFTVLSAAITASVGSGIISETKLRKRKKKRSCPRRHQQNFMKRLIFAHRNDTYTEYAPGVMTFNTLSI